MQPAKSLRILFPEGSSLSAREALSALGRQGYTIDICDPNPQCICRFSHYVHAFHHCPSWGTHPVEYLRFLVHLLKHEHYDVLLPVHEQAFLFARVRESLSQLVGVAVAAEIAQGIELARGGGGIVELVAVGLHFEVMIGADLLERIDRACRGGVEAARDQQL